MIKNLIFEFNRTFIVEARWELFFQGLQNTILIAICSTIIGVFIGILVAVVRVYYSQNKPKKGFANFLLYLRDKGFGGFLLWLLDKIFTLYVLVIRGTPMIVQIMIMYFVVFPSVSNGIPIAILALGFNSGAYVSEIFRAGILSIDKGQTEAGLSLGLSSAQTMRKIILPQAIKNVLPAIGNEFIILLKDTSLVAYISVLDLTYAANLVKSRTYSAFFPLLSIAVIYLILVLGLTTVLSHFERRLAVSDRR